jgi:hypothetical protein
MRFITFLGGVAGVATSLSTNNFHHGILPLKKQLGKLQTTQKKVMDYHHNKQHQN